MPVASETANVAQPVAAASTQETIHQFVRMANALHAMNVNMIQKVFGSSALSNLENILP